MTGIYFTSDLHYGHKNLVRGTSSWEDKTACRNFDTLEEHNEVLIQNINNKVSWDSILYFLGDFAFGGIDNIWKFRNRINCRTIHFIGGNHDHHIRNNKIVRTDSGFINIQQLFSSYNEILTKKIGGQQIVQCHYPFRSWEGASKGSWMLFAHEHGRLPDYIVNGVIVKSKDAGIDTHPNFEPYHFDEIKTIMDKREILIAGHHD